MSFASFVPGARPRAAFVLLSSLLLPSAFAADSERLARSVPQGLLFFAECADVKKLESEFKGSDYWRFFHDPACQPLMDFFDKIFEEMSSEISSKTSADFEVLLDSAAGRAAVFSYSISKKDYTDPRPQESEPEAFGMLLDVSGEHDVFVTEFEKLLEKDIAEKKLTREQRDVDGVDVSVCLMSEERDIGEVGYGFVNDTFFLVARRTASPIDSFSDIVRGLRGELEATLASTEIYSNAIGDQPGDFSFFLDVRQILADELERDEALGIPVEALQREMFEAVGAFAGSGIFDQGSIDVTQRLTWASDDRFLALLRKAFPARASQMIARVPDRPYLAASFQVDVEGIMDMIVELGAEQAGESPAELRTQMEASFEREGFHVKRDVLDNLGGEITVFVGDVKDELEALPGSEDQPMNFAALISLEDSRGIETALDVILREEGLHAIRERQEFEGQAYFSIPTPLGVKAFYALTPDSLIVSGSSELLIDVLRRSKDTELPTLAKSAGFQAAMERIGAEQTGFYTIDFPRFVPLIFADMWTEMGSDSAPPTEEVARKYFQAIDLISARIDEKGLSMRSLHLQVEK